MHSSYNDKEIGFDLDDELDILMFNDSDFESNSSQKKAPEYTNSDEFKEFIKK